MPVASAFIAIAPPSASISLTIWLLAEPPIAGLHDIWPIVSRFCVNISVRQPSRADAKAASIPACPLPTTITSYLVGSLNMATSFQNSLVGMRQQICELEFLNVSRHRRRNYFQVRIEFSQDLSAGTA